jgi:hypothetical protein
MLVSRSVLLFACTSGLVGCVQMPDIVRTRASNDFPCASDQVSVRGIGGTSFRATGCGHEETYDCSTTGAGYLCVPERAGGPPKPNG